MISICIPIYNCDASALVTELQEQCRRCIINYEIVLLDDASDNLECKEKNTRLSVLPNVHLHTNTENLGSARTRNKLGSLAKYPYILFIDGDAEVVRLNFIERYIKLCQSGAVYFGGCLYPEKCPDEKYILRWKYGKNREEGLGKYFSCFNFLVDKDIFLRYPFSERFRQYGYEDALFGLNLQYNGIDTFFIDNPLLHEGLVSAQDYLRRINLSLANLLEIEVWQEEKKFVSSIRILKASKLLKKFYLTSLFILFWKITKSFCLKNLESKNPSLFILDLYKLGYYCSLKK